MQSVTNKALIITGASGVGKGTIIKSLQNRNQTKFQFVLSFTTRQKRPNQVEGVDYLYVNQSQFTHKIPEMLQHKHVHKNMYGTSRKNLQQILATNRIPILDIDVEGMMEIKNKIECEVLCLLPASWELLRERLQNRRTESQQIVDRRMKENIEQVQKMISLRGQSKIWYVQNYQYQLTVFGIEKWLNENFLNFRSSYSL